MTRLYCSILLLLAMLIPRLRADAHPMPHSVLLLDVHTDRIAAELQWPLKELQVVFPGEALDTAWGTLLARKGAWLDRYLRQHLRIADSAGRPWTWGIQGKRVTADEQDATGAFHEVVFQLWMKPPPGSSPRHFVMHYNAIMHQLVTHKMYIAIRQDWDGGLSKEDSADADLGVLMVSPGDMTVPPVIVDLDEGNRWKGFKSMVSLGMDHIAEGADHLMFLLVLLLSAPLLAVGRRWVAAAGSRYGLVRVVKIATAFTVGHSLTLLAGAVGWLRLPSQPVEVAIAASILITAVHALRPIFPKREVWVAAGFGLVHGLAFAATLANLRLDAGRMALSILGFNAGIEMAQLFILLLVMPWLLMLRQSRIYRYVRIMGAVLAGIGSVGWISERVSGKSNLAARFAEQAGAYGRWMVLALAVLALVSRYWPGIGAREGFTKSE